MTKAAVLCGLGAWLPPRIVPNSELADTLDTSDEWITTRTGVRARHIADAGMATSDLAVQAGERALKSAGMSNVDAVVLATTTPDHPCPATAPAVSARLGLGTVAAFDVNAVCSGFLYGLMVGAGMIATGNTSSVLLIGADTYSRILDPTDRSTRVIFGDGAGAVVLRAGDPAEPGAIGPIDLGSDGDNSHLIAIAAGGSREPFHDGGDPYFRMRGKEVFRHAVVRMTQSAQSVLRRTDWPDGLPDLLVAHQANVRIVHAVADQLGLPRERCAIHLDRVGNTAAASLPLALADAVTTRRLTAGTRVLLASFGGGLTWGACALRWPELSLT
ncbi:ketoacyl-ACP synthase III [Kibdelosporangium aridum]|uniref:Beta-ketoacyl-[acyl-carrier-protein] synthase III n=1 Tax=Kibdelosporangium aridum TaxID=2030 RepID=A0A428Z314_KIBAR|nr:beta-ketoacyl-ACP synthase III [Kibdelosporangium aridum]RSM80081.1 ketoacyl-ACP synthase III [Kibdelosporangium aridum]